MSSIQFPPIFFALLFAATVSAILTVIAWRRRPATGAEAIAVLMLGSTLWAGLDAFQQLLVEYEPKQFVDMLCYLGILLVAPAWLIFSLNYTAWGGPRRKRSYTWVLIEPVFVILCLTVQPLQRLFYPAKHLVSQGGFVYLVLEHGPLFWVHAGYSYLFVLAGSVLLLYHLTRTSNIFKWQTIVLILAMLPPWLANIYYVSENAPLPGLDLTPFSFIISGMLIILGVFRYRLLDLTPRGRDALIEVMKDFVIVLDGMNRIVDINKSASDFLGETRNAIIGHFLAEYSKPWQPVVEPYLAQTEAHDTIVIERGSDTFHFDLRITPLYDPNGRKAGKLVIFRDVSETYLIQKALRESEARYRYLVETSPDAILLTSLKGRLVLYNQVAADIHDVPHKENLAGRLVYDFVAEEDRERVRQASYKALETGELQKIEFTSQAIDGRRFPSELSLTIIRNQDGDPSGFIGVLRDITVRKKTEEELRQTVASEHRQQEIANALREMGVVLTMSLDFDTMLDSLLEQLIRILPFDSGNITMVTGKKAYIARSLGYEKFGEDIPEKVRKFVFDIQGTMNFQWMLENKRPLIIPDTSTYPGWVSLKETSYIRSWLGAPIIARDEVLAFFNLDSCQVSAFTEEHLHILETFAAQAGLAMQNTLLYKDATETLDRTRRLNDILQRVGNNLDISAVLSDILKFGSDLVGAQACALFMYEAKTRALEAEGVYASGGRSLEPVEPDQAGGVNWRVFASGEPLLEDEVSTDPDHTRFGDAHQVHSALVVPIRAGKNLMGTLDFMNFDVNRTFREKDIPIAVTLGREAGEIIQNVRLFEDVQRRAEEAETLREASNAVTSALNLDYVLGQIIANLDKVVPFDSCTVFLKVGEQLKIVAVRGFEDSERLLGQMYPLSNPLATESISNHKVVILEDAKKDPRFMGWGSAARVRGWMGIPLFAHGSVTGYLSIDSYSPGVYTREDADLAQAFANQAAIAIDNARLYEQAEQLAISDPLTGLFNRRHFFELARNEFYRARRYAANLSLMMVDVDDLKLVNDSYGHQAGDQLIEFIGDRTRQVLRQADIPSRYAGDEFVILLPETGLEKAVKVGLRLQASLAGGIEYGEKQRIPVNVSIGVSELDEDCFSLEALLNRSDQALYAAKHSGKNNLFVWDNGEFEQREPSDAGSEERP